MPHLYKYTKVGAYTKAGKRFIDGPTIGKKAARIIEVTLFERKGLKYIFRITGHLSCGRGEKDGVLESIS